MRTFTVVPSFEGESAYFELPDIGFQGDHLSFAILFNLTELTEHWPNIQPTMIVTDSQSNTFIAPNTNWDSETHIFTWNISSTETAYEGDLHCQLKCIAADDPTTIVCMSRICQTHVYASLAAAEDPPEAFQNWLDTLTLLGAQVSEDVNTAISVVEASEVNARAAQDAADDAASIKSDIETIQQSVETTASAVQADKAAVLDAKQQALEAAQSAETSKNAAIDAADESLENLEASDSNLVAARLARDTAVDAASQASTAMGGSRAAQAAAERAQGIAESARDTAVQASDDAVDAKDAAEAAQGVAEASEDRAVQAEETAVDAAEQSKKWAIGKDLDDTPVPSTDAAHNNYAQYWAGRSQADAQSANEAKDTILNTRMSTARYSDDDESITFTIGTTMLING